MCLEMMFYLSASNFSLTEYILKIPSPIVFKTFIVKLNLVSVFYGAEDELTKIYPRKRGSVHCAEMGLKMMNILLRCKKLKN